MDITVYLPGDIGERAKAAEPDLNLSRLLRNAVVEELARRERVATLLTDAKEHELSLLTKDDVPYTGVLTGKLLTVSGDLWVYLATDERLMVYDEHRQTVAEVGDVEDLRGRLDATLYIDVCNAMGKTARVEV